MLRELSPEYSIRVQKGSNIDENATALLLFHPTLWEMTEENNALKDSDIILVAIVEEFRHLLYEAVFPDAVILDDGEVLTPEILRKTKRKEIGPVR